MKKLEYSEKLILDRIRYLSPLGRLCPFGPFLRRFTKGSGSGRFEFFYVQESHFRILDPC